MTEPVTLSVEDGLARLTLNRPDALNAINRELAEALMAAAVRCATDPAVRAVLMTGAGGKAFCVGGDLKSFHAQGDGIAAHLKETTHYLHAACSTLARMDPPLVVAVQGAAAGAGFSLALLGDLVYAAESAVFTMAYTAAGLSPDGGSTFLLPRVVGLRRAQELTLTNRRLTGAEAAAWGVATACVADADLDRHRRGRGAPAGRRPDPLVRSRPAPAGRQLRHRLRDPDGARGQQHRRRRRRAGRPRGAGRVPQQAQAGVPGAGVGRPASEVVTRRPQMNVRALSPSSSSRTNARQRGRSGTQPTLRRPRIASASGVKTLREGRRAASMKAACTRGALSPSSSRPSAARAGTHPPPPW